MIARTLTFLAGAALIAAPALAETPAGWTRADLPEGHGSFATPCSEEVRLQVSDKTSFCEADGVAYVVDVSAGSEFMDGEYGNEPYDAARDDLLKDADTRRLVEGETGGLRSFRTDGSASDGGIGMGLVELRPDLMLTIMVRIIGDEVTHASIEQALDDMMDSLEIAAK